MNAKTVELLKRCKKELRGVRRVRLSQLLADNVRPVNDNTAMRLTNLLADIDAAIQEAEK